MLLYFCGVIPGTSAGHFCYPNRGPISPWGAAAPMVYPLLDWHPERDGAKGPRLEYFQRGNPPQIEGEFVHVQAAGWTMIAAWDRSADPRGGCTATFAMDALLDMDEALSAARGAWPAVFARIETRLGRPVTIRTAVPALARSW